LRSSGIGVKKWVKGYKPKKLFSKKICTNEKAHLISSLSVGRDDPANGGLSD